MTSVLSTVRPRWELRADLRPEERCYAGVSERTGNVLGFVQTFVDGSAAYWNEPQQQARLARTVIEARNLAMPIGDVLGDLDVQDPREVSLVLLAASASGGSASLQVAIRSAAHSRETWVAFSKRTRKEARVDNAIAVRQLQLEGALSASIYDYDAFVRGDEE